MTAVLVTMVLCFALTNLMATGGISRRLVECAKSLVGGVQGG